MLALGFIAALVFATLAMAHLRRPKWLPEMWYRLGVCETGLNWRHSTTDYGGAFGFYRGSWDDYKPGGYPDEPEQATPREQYVVALRIARDGLGGWGCVTRQDALGDWVRAAA